MLVLTLGYESGIGSGPCGYWGDMMRYGGMGYRHMGGFGFGGFGVCFGYSL